MEPALGVVVEGFNLSLARKRVRNDHFFITHSLRLPQGWSPFFSCHAECSEASQSLKEETLRLLHSLRVTKREEEIATLTAFARNGEKRHNDLPFLSPRGDVFYRRGGLSIKTEIATLTEPALSRFCEEAPRFCHCEAL